VFITETATGSAGIASTGTTEASTGATIASRGSIPTVDNSVGKGFEYVASIVGNNCSVILFAFKVKVCCCG
jgi:hypothetical protein